MATGALGNQARNQPRQVANTWRKQINWNDPNNGVNVPQIVIPQGAFIFGVFCEIVIAFDGTPSLIMGSGVTPNNLIATADVNELAIGVYEVTRGYGRSLTAAGDLSVSTRLTSTAATVGQAELMMVYEGNNG